MEVVAEVAAAFGARGGDRGGTGAEFADERERIGSLGTIGEEGQAVGRGGHDPVLCRRGVAKSPNEQRERASTMPVRQVLARRGRAWQEAGMTGPKSRTPQAGGFLLAACVLIGVFVGASKGQASIGFLAGLAAGVVLALLVWLIDRARR